MPTPELLKEDRRQKEIAQRVRDALVEFYGDDKTRFSDDLMRSAARHQASMLATKAGVSADDMRWAFDYAWETLRREAIDDELKSMRFDLNVTSADGTWIRVELDGVSAKALNDHIRSENWRSPVTVTATDGVGLTIFPENTLYISVTKMDNVSPAETSELDG